MSDVSAEQVLVWDSSALHHFAKTDRVDVLAQLARPFHNVSTRVVMSELQDYGLAATVLDPGWLEVVPLDGLHELRAFVEWSQRFGLNSAQDAGEATVLAWAQVHRAVAMVDDGDARRSGQGAGLTVHGTLWLLAQAVRSGVETPSSVAGLLRVLQGSGARYPAEAVLDFSQWALRQGLLP